MKRLLLIGLILFTTACPPPPDVPDEPDDIVVQNLSSGWMVFLSIVPANATEWGANWLENDPLAPQSVRFFEPDYPDGYYQILVGMGAEDGTVSAYLNDFGLMYLGDGKPDVITVTDS